MWCKKHQALAAKAQRTSDPPSLDGGTFSRTLQTPRPPPGPDIEPNWDSATLSPEPISKKLEAITKDLKACKNVTGAYGSMQSLPMRHSHTCQALRPSLPRSHWFCEVRKTSMVQRNAPRVGQGEMKKGRSNKPTGRPKLRIESNAIFTGACRRYLDWMLFCERIWSRNPCSNKQDQES